MKRFQQEGSKLVEVDDKDDLAETQNRLQDIAEDEDKNIAVDASSLPTPKDDSEQKKGPH
jgi:hypothetical protein